ncbi:MAG: motility protein A [Chloroflexota bacterium]|nr:MAG: motility protein A [Chloroflexota bacterium]
MDLAAIGGLALAVLLVIGAIVVEGGGDFGTLAGYVPTSGPVAAAYMLVVGGTMAATTVTSPLEGAIGMPKAILKALMPGHHEAPVDLALLFVRLSEKARREGLLSLEEEEAAIHNEFMKKGMRQVVDGTDPEVIRQILEIDIQEMERRHNIPQTFLTQAGGFAPTFGIIGTVSSLIAVLAHLDPSAGQEVLAQSISAAFIATFLGLATANLIFLPLAEKMKENTHHEVAMRNMMVEGILAVQAGDNPRLVFEKLEGFIIPAQREAARQRSESGPAGQQAA